MRTLKFFPISILSLALLACEQDNTITAESISLNENAIQLTIGDQFQLTATVLPEDAQNKSTIWSSSNKNVASVNEVGLVSATGPGNAVITASYGGIKADCSVTSLMPPQIGDIYYSDGSWSSELDRSKTPIGVIFYTGNPSVDDPLLRQDHPECTNGLAVALNGEEYSAWQTYGHLFGHCVGEWISQHSPDYISIMSDAGADANMQKILGYNNTKAIEFFNSAEENASWPVDAVKVIVNYREKCKAPSSSSDWYLPSSKELSLLCSGIYDGNIFYYANDVDNRDFINSRLALLNGAELLHHGTSDAQGFYWASTENNETVSLVHFFNHRGCTGFSPKSTSGVLVRSILAF